MAAVKMKRTDLIRKICRSQILQEIIREKGGWLKNDSQVLTWKSVTLEYIILCPGKNSRIEAITLDFVIYKYYAKSCDLIRTSNVKVRISRDSKNIAKINSGEGSVCTWEKSKVDCFGLKRPIDVNKV